MELDLGPEMAAFRREIREWIANNAPEGLSDLADWRTPVIGVSHRPGAGIVDTDPIYAEWDRRLVDASIVCAHWPEEVGGRGWNGVQMAVFDQECHRAGVPRVERGMGETLVGPSIITHGTPDQKAYFLPRIISGEDVYCQGFSEPGNGSDLAGLQTRGVVDGDHLVITGQKVWTSDAERANMIFLLCRTDPGRERHRGLSFVLAPIAGNHMEIRPLRQLSGATRFCEVFLDGAHAPMFNVIGGLNEGWRVAMTTLGYERGGRAAVQYHLAAEREFQDLVETVRRRGLTGEPAVRRELAEAYTRVQIMRFSGMRLLTTMAYGRDPGPEASVSKLFWSEHHQRVGELAMDVCGPRAMVRPEGPDYPTDRWQHIFLTGRANTIFSGTSEIQRNIIAERVLGMPKG